ncbi:unnamed protein product [Calypogeia fissa]
MDPRVSLLVALAFAVFACTNAQFGSDLRTECDNDTSVEESYMKAIYQYCITEKKCPAEVDVPPKSTQVLHTAGGAQLVLKNNRDSIAKISRDADIGPSLTKIMGCPSPTAEQLTTHHGSGSPSGHLPHDTTPGPNRQGQGQGQGDGHGHVHGKHIFQGKVIGNLGEQGTFGARDAQIIIQKVKKQSGEEHSVGQHSGPKPSPSPLKSVKGRL